MKDKKILKGLVIQSSKNILIALAADKEGSARYECRIKGKVLKTDSETYNLAVPGDWVTIERENVSNNVKENCVQRAMILSVEQRRNFFSRYNQKGSLSQILAANIDLILCVCAPLSPPFRPRFIDRILLQAEIAGIEAAVICNKIDLSRGDPDVNERLEEYSRIGYKVLNVSAKTKEGIKQLYGEIKGKTCALTGQSGTGKSSLINALNPRLGIKEGLINEKYDRGVHTTTMSIMHDLGTLYDNTRIIDTPGIRLFIPDGINKNEAINFMREFAVLAGKCSYGMSCSHKTEVGCKILEAVDAGIIHEDRYESFIRITEDLERIEQKARIKRRAGIK
ncbi:MAG: ribosome small subunit-dependent GTPase A [Treponema sp.]|nr:ribosome small subunit-dependent GTPase A [Treponema sp.]